MYYLQSRYYDPKIGRFINADSYASTGTGILGNNMFAYCNNNPASYEDSSGYSLWPSTVATNDGSRNYYGGNTSSIGIALPIPIGEERLTSTIEDLWDSITKSFARAKNTAYKTDREVHHLVAQSASNAEQARTIVETVLPAGVENPLNKISIKTGLHRRIHTKLYYYITNTIIINAYNSAEGDPNKQNANVILALTTIRAWVSAMDQMAPF